MPATSYRRLARDVLSEAGGSLSAKKLVKRLAKAARTADAPDSSPAAAGAWVAAALDAGTLDVGDDGRLVYVDKKKAAKRKRAAGGESGRPERAAAPPPPPPPPAMPDRRSRGVPAGTSAAAAEAAATAAAAPSSLPAWRASIARGDVKKGRFSDAERDALVAAVRAYAASKGLPQDDTAWLFETRTGPEKDRARGAWKAVAAALPHRTVKSVWAAGTRILHPGNYAGRWTEADVARLRQLVAERGRAWARVGAALGRLPEACRDKWREVGGGAHATGRWTAVEAAALDGAVRAHLAARAGGAAAAAARAADDPSSLPLPPAGANATPHGTLDGVDWDAVAAAVGTRSALQCREKWYDQLSPSMVDRGDWGRGDDRRLLAAVLALPQGAAEHEIGWEGLVPGRAGAAAKRRWALMKKAAPKGAGDAPRDVARALAAVHAPRLLEE